MGGMDCPEGGAVGQQQLNAETGRRKVEIV
jgi:hypothetical protein